VNQNTQPSSKRDGSGKPENTEEKRLATIDSVS